MRLISILMCGLLYMTSGFAFAMVHCETTAGHYPRVTVNFYPDNLTEQASDRGEVIVTIEKQNVLDIQRYHDSELVNFDNGYVKVRYKSGHVKIPYTDEFKKTGLLQHVSSSDVFDMKIDCYVSSEG